MFQPEILFYLPSKTYGIERNFRATVQHGSSEETKICKYYLSPVQQKRSEPEPSCVSMKSDVSMTDPIISKSEDTHDALGSVQQKRSEPEPSCVSMKSDVCMTDPIKFNGKDTQPDLSPVQQKRSEPEPSCVSMKSDVSMTDPIISKSEDTRDGLRVDHGGESRITAGPKKYACFLTLDPNTAHTKLIVSEENREVTGGGKSQPYPDHPDRFDVCSQVLCRESVCGSCYWEIEWSGGVCISVSYNSISRKGSSNESVFGRNDQSWSLICSPSSYSFRHNNIETDLPVKPTSSRIGVYVDHSAGTLSFYSFSRNTMSLIHTVQTTFSQPLYPGFNVNFLSSVKLC
uniref:B30.2/SPRY domain-containing protein n=1 Tax=Cyprinus carpio TaxID=7962 RepID=A0A8C2CCU5_CYPCA